MPSSQFAKEDYLQPLAEARINSVFIPSWHVEVEQTAYSVADTASASTFLAGSPVDYGALTQKVLPCPFEVFLGTRDTRASSKQQGARLFYGLVDQIDTSYHTDVISITARGVAALLIDQRITTRFDMNSTVDQVISHLITSYRLKAQVATTDVPVGKILQQDYVSTARNSRAFDVINLLADGLGWNVRVQGTTVIVGPPPTRGNVPELSKVWDTNAGMELDVQHSALHARDIKVVVHSYIPRLKSRTGNYGGTSNSQPTLGLPSQAPAGAPVSSGPTGRQTGFTSVGETTGQVYSFHVPGLTSTQCDHMAAKIRDDITRHEFVATLKFAPTKDELKQLVSLGTEFTVMLSGCEQASHNGLYHPNKVVWAWDLGDSNSGQAEGLTCEVTMLNHELPVPTGGL